MIKKAKSLFRLYRACCIRILSCMMAAPLAPKSCVILAPHPDDETFGCGQLIAECAASQKKVYVVFLSDGTGSHQNCCDLSPLALAEKRRGDAFKAMKILGVPEENLYFCDLPDGRLSEAIPSKYNDLKNLIASFQCNTLLVPHPEEGWADHLAVTRLGNELADALQLKLYYYCVWFYFSMPFRKFINVKWRSSCFSYLPVTYEKKCAACNIYLKNLASCGNPYAGALPHELISAIISPKEVFFER